MAKLSDRAVTMLSIDPPAERAISCTGWSYGEFSDTQPFALLGSGVVAGGFAGFCADATLPKLLRAADVVVIEHYVVYNKNGDPTPLLAEGVARFLRPDAVLQRSSGKNTLVPDDAMKALGLWSTKGHHHDEREAIRHALVYLVKSRHLPTLRLVHNR